MPIPLDPLIWLRILVALVGLWYQTGVLLGRLGQYEHRASYDEVDRVVLDWHVERGVLLFVAHLLLLVAALITLAVRIGYPDEDGPDIYSLSRMVIDVALIGITALLTTVSYRASYHHERLMDTLSRRSPHV